VARIPFLPRDNRAAFAVLWLVIAAILAAGWVAIVEVSAREKSAALDAARRDGRNLAHVFAEQATRTIQSIDQSLIYLAASLTRDKGAAFQDATTNFAAARDLIAQISAIDSRGDLLVSNLGGTPGQVNVADREHFIVHRDRLVEGLFISKPVKEWLSGQWPIQFARQLSAADGSFNGIIVASVAPYGLARFYDQLAVGGGIVNLVGRDGYIRSRSALTEETLSTPVSCLPIFRHLQTSRTGHFISKSLVDGIDRLYSYHALDDYPMIAAVGVSLVEEPRVHQQRWRSYQIAGAVGSAILVLFAIFMTRSMMVAAAANEKLRSTSAQLQTSEERFRDFAEATADWFWEQDRDFRFTYMSPSNFRISGIPPDHFMGKTRWEVAVADLETPSWRDHTRILERRLPFRDFRFFRENPSGAMPHVSVSG